MKELIKTIFTTSTERIKNPLIGTFVIAWIAFNWRPIAVFLFSEATIDIKIEVINTTYISIWNQLLFPIFISLIYTLLIPYLMLVFDFIVAFAISSRKAIKTKQIEKDLQSDIRVSTLKKNLEEANNKDINYSELSQTIENLVKTSSLQNFVINLLITGDRDITKFENFDLKEMGYAIEKYTKFRNTEFFVYFNDIVQSVKQSNTVPDGIDVKITHKYIEEGIIQQISLNHMPNKGYILTDLGKIYKIIMKKEELLSSQVLN